AANERELAALRARVALVSLKAGLADLFLSHDNRAGHALCDRRRRRGVTVAIAVSVAVPIAIAVHWLHVRVLGRAECRRRRSGRSRFDDALGDDLLLLEIVVGVV